MANIDDENSSSFNALGARRTIGSMGPADERGYTVNAYTVSEREIFSHPTSYDKGWRSTLDRERQVHVRVQPTSSGISSAGLVYGQDTSQRRQELFRGLPAGTMTTYLVDPRSGYYEFMRQRGDTLVVSNRATQPSLAASMAVKYLGTQNKNLIEAADVFGSQLHAKVGVFGNRWFVGTGNVTLSLERGQFNYFASGTDANILKQVQQVVTDVRNNRAPKSSENIIVTNPSSPTSGLTQLLNLVSQTRGQGISVISATLSNEHFVNALIEKAKTGEAVNIVMGGTGAVDRSRQQLQYNRLTQAAQYFPSLKVSWANQSVHANAIASTGQYNLFAVGSARFSGAALGTNPGTDAMIHFQNAQAAASLEKQIRDLGSFDSSQSGVTYSPLGGYLRAMTPILTHPGKAGSSLSRFQYQNYFVVSPSTLFNHKTRDMYRYVQHKMPEALGTEQGMGFFAYIYKESYYKGYQKFPDKLPKSVVMLDRAYKVPSLAEHWRNEAEATYGENSIQAQLLTPRGNRSVFGVALVNLGSIIDQRLYERRQREIDESNDYRPADATKHETFADLGRSIDNTLFLLGTSAMTVRFSMGAMHFAAVAADRVLGVAPYLDAEFGQWASQGSRTGAFLHSVSGAASTTSRLGNSFIRGASAVLFSALRGFLSPFGRDGKGAIDDVIKILNTQATDVVLMRTKDHALAQRIAGMQPNAVIHDITAFYDPQGNEVGRTVINSANPGVMHQIGTVQPGLRSGRYFEVVGQNMQRSLTDVNRAIHARMAQFMETIPGFNYLTDLFGLEANQSGIAARHFRLQAFDALMRGNMQEFRAHSAMAYEIMHSERTLAFTRLSAERVMLRKAIPFLFGAAAINHAIGVMASANAATLESQIDVNARVAHAGGRGHVRSFGFRDLFRVDSIFEVPFVAFAALSHTASWTGQFLYNLGVGSTAASLAVGASAGYAVNRALRRFSPAAGRYAGLIAGLAAGISFALTVGANAARRATKMTTIITESGATAAPTIIGEAGTGLIPGKASVFDYILAAPKFFLDMFTALDRRTKHEIFANREGLTFKVITQQAASGMMTTEALRNYVMSQKNLTVEQAAEQAELMAILDIARAWAGNDSTTKVKTTQAYGARIGYLPVMSVWFGTINQGDRWNFMFQIMGPIGTGAAFGAKLPFYWSRERSKGQFNKWMDPELPQDPSFINRTLMQLVQGQSLGAGAAFTLGAAAGLTGGALAGGITHTFSARGARFSGQVGAAVGLFAATAVTASTMTGFYPADRFSSAAQFIAGLGYQAGTPWEAMLRVGAASLALAWEGAPLLLAAGYGASMLYAHTADITLSSTIDFGRSLLDFRMHGQRFMNYVRTGHTSFVTQESKYSLNLFKNLTKGTQMRYDNAGFMGRAFYGTAGVGLKFIRTLIDLPVHVLIGAPTQALTYTAQFLSGGRVSAETSRLAQASRLAMMGGRAAIPGLVIASAFIMGDTLRQSRGHEQGYNRRIEGWLKYIPSILQDPIAGIIAKKDDRHHNPEDDARFRAAILDGVVEEMGSQGFKGRYKGGIMGTVDMLWSSLLRSFRMARGEELIMPSELYGERFMPVHRIMEEIDKDTFGFSSTKISTPLFAASILSVTSSASASLPRESKEDKDVDVTLTLALAMSHSKNIIKKGMPARRRPAFMGKMFSSMSPVHTASTSLRIALSTRYNLSRAALGMNPFELQKYYGDYFYAGKSRRKVTNFVSYTYELKDDIGGTHSGIENTPVKRYVTGLITRARNFYDYNAWKLLSSGPGGQFSGAKGLSQAYDQATQNMINDIDIEDDWSIFAALTHPLNDPSAKFLKDPKAAANLHQAQLNWMSQELTRASALVYSLLPFGTAVVAAGIGVGLGINALRNYGVGLTPEQHQARLRAQLARRIERYAPLGQSHQATSSGGLVSHASDPVTAKSVVTTNGGYRVEYRVGEGRVSIGDANGRFFADTVDAATGDRVGGKRKADLVKQAFNTIANQYKGIAGLRSVESLVTSINEITTKLTPFEDAMRAAIAGGADIDIRNMEEARRNLEGLRSRFGPAPGQTAASVMATDVDVAILNEYEQMLRALHQNFGRVLGLQVISGDIAREVFPDAGSVAESTVTTSNLQHQAMPHAQGNVPSVQGPNPAEYNAIYSNSDADYLRQHLDNRLSRFYQRTGSRVRGVTGAGLYYGKRVLGHPIGRGAGLIGLGALGGYGASLLSSGSGTADSAELAVFGAGMAASFLTATGNFVGNVFGITNLVTGVAAQSATNLTQEQKLGFAQMGASGLELVLSLGLFTMGGMLLGGYGLAIGAAVGAVAVVTGGAALYSPTVRNAVGSAAQGAVNLYHRIHAGLEHAVSRIGSAVPNNAASNSVVQGAVNLQLSVSNLLYGLEAAAKQTKSPMWEGFFRGARHFQEFMMPFAPQEHVMAGTHADREGHSFTALNPLFASISPIWWGDSSGIGWQLDAMMVEVQRQEAMRLSGEIGNASVLEMVAKETLDINPSNNYLPQHNLNAEARYMSRGARAGGLANVQERRAFRYVNLSTPDRIIQAELHRRGVIYEVGYLGNLMRRPDQDVSGFAGASDRNSPTGRSYVAPRGGGGGRGRSSSVSGGSGSSSGGGTYPSGGAGWRGEATARDKAAFIMQALQSHGHYPKGQYALPIKGMQPGNLSAPFWQKRTKASGDTYHHTGIDVAYPTGTPIRAVAAGTVAFAGWAQGYGNFVAIKHENGVVSRYGHASALATAVGRHVDAGELIAFVGSTGHSTGPHLHFEVLVNGRYVNPSQVLFSKVDKAGEEKLERVKQALEKNLATGKNIKDLNYEVLQQHTRMTKPQVAAALETAHRKMVSEGFVDQKLKTKPFFKHQERERSITEGIGYLPVLAFGVLVAAAPAIYMGFKASRDAKEAAAKAERIKEAIKKYAFKTLFHPLPEVGLNAPYLQPGGPQLGPYPDILPNPSQTQVSSTQTTPRRIFNPVPIHTTLEMLGLRTVRASDKPIGVNSHQMPIELIGVNSHQILEPVNVDSHQMPIELIGVNSHQILEPVNVDSRRILLHATAAEIKARSVSLSIRATSQLVSSTPHLESQATETSSFRQLRQTIHTPLEMIGRRTVSKSSRSVSSTPQPQSGPEPLAPQSKVQVLGPVNAKAVSETSSNKVKILGAASNLGHYAMRGLNILGLAMAGYDAVQTVVAPTEARRNQAGFNLVVAAGMTAAAILAGFVLAPTLGSAALILGGGLALSYGIYRLDQHLNNRLSQTLGPIGAAPGKFLRNAFTHEKQTIVHPLATPSPTPTLTPTPSPTPSHSPTSFATSMLKNNSVLSQEAQAQESLAATNRIKNTPVFSYGDYSVNDYDVFYSRPTAENSPLPWQQFRIPLGLFRNKADISVETRKFKKFSSFLQNVKTYIDKNPGVKPVITLPVHGGGGNGILLYSINHVNKDFSIVNVEAASYGWVINQLEAAKIKASEVDIVMGSCNSNSAYFRTKNGFTPEAKFNLENNYKNYLKKEYNAKVVTYKFYDAKPKNNNYNFYTHTGLSKMLDTSELVSYFTQNPSLVNAKTLKNQPKVDPINNYYGNQEDYELVRAVRQGTAYILPSNKKQKTVVIKTSKQKAKAKVDTACTKSQTAELAVEGGKVKPKLRKTGQVDQASNPEVRGSLLDNAYTFMKSMHIF